MLGTASSWMSNDVMRHQMTSFDGASVDIIKCWCSFVKKHHIKRITASMPVISFANSKGGSGKSTSALVIACEFAEAADVILIDADPRRPLAAWAQLSEPPKRLHVISSGGERTIQDEIDEAAAKVPFVLVDLEGMASQLATFAMSASDLVIVPAQEQHQDAQAAVDTLGAVKRAGRAARRVIPAAVLLTRTRAAVKSRTARHIGEQLRGLDGVNVIGPELVERDAFAALFSSGGGLRQLDPGEVNGIDKAIANASAIASEIVTILRKGQGAAA
ncbi:ParA family protein (plasmid) [Roseivivax marinus]|uniref:ParA family protein n=1 Tax=Roseivivax marinus TaxID=1379903 RepID=UPI001F035295|nr:ParA family protein [Roseivivax marinus]UMA67239.1 ParA family protein [Roseivivax marinus]